MNTQNNTSRVERSRRHAVVAALVVSLVGLTVAPGWSCSYQDGQRKVEVQSQE